MDFKGKTYIEMGFAVTMLTAAVYVGMDHNAIANTQNELADVKSVVRMNSGFISEVRERLSRIEGMLQELVRQQKE